MTQLRTELEKRGINRKGKKPELKEELADRQKGNSNVPAFLQKTPEASLASINLEKYEVFPTEPLHVLKGHIKYIIDEAAKITSGESKEILKQVQHIPQQMHLEMFRLSQGLDPDLSKSKAIQKH